MSRQGLGKPSHPTHGDIEEAESPLLGLCISNVCAEWKKEKLSRPREDLEQNRFPTRPEPVVTPQLTRGGFGGRGSQSEPCCKS